MTYTAGVKMMIGRRTVLDPIRVVSLSIGYRDIGCRLYSIGPHKRCVVFEIS